MKNIKFFIKKIFNKEKISEIKYIDEEINHYKKIQNNIKPTYLSKDIKLQKSINILIIFKNELNIRYKKYIISKLNKFPINISCVDKIICKKIGITKDEFKMVIYETIIFESRSYTPVFVHNKPYYNAGIYDNGTVIITNDNPDSLFNWIIYKRLIFGWKITEFNGNFYYKRI